MATNRFQVSNACQDQTTLACLVEYRHKLRNIAVYPVMDPNCLVIQIDSDLDRIPNYNGYKIIDLSVPENENIQ